MSPRAVRPRTPDPPRAPRRPRTPDPPRAPRRLRTAEILAIGSELTNGETRDTNGGELAGWLSAAGVLVEGIASLPDDTGLVSDALGRALACADLVITTGGLGPTPDDLTREAIAAIVGEKPQVDPGLETWLRAIFERRGIAFPELNLKQAWLIPSATPIPNERGTAPGWWVDRPDGRVLVALPGPPREMRPLWHAWVRPRLDQRGLGDGRVVRTLRTTGIGESQVVERLGEALLRGANPVVATYARADAVDIRVSAVGDASPADAGARTAAGIVDATVEAVRAALGSHVWAEGETTWAEALTDALASRGWTLATEEVGTHGALVGLLAEAGGVLAERVLAADPAAGPVADLEDRARAVAAAAGSDVGLVLVAVPAGRDTLARIALASPGGSRFTERLLFLGGTPGRMRAAIAAAAALLEALARVPDAGPAQPGPEPPSVS